MEFRGANTVNHWNNKHLQQYGDNKQYDFEAIKNTTDSYFHAASKILEENKDVFENKSLLDLGCSNGLFCAYIKMNILPDFSITGSDFSPSGIRIAKDKAKELNLDIEYELRDFLLNPIDKDYGVITCFETIEHIEEGTNYKVLDNILDHCEYAIISTVSTIDDCMGEHISHYTLDTFEEKGYDVLWKANLHKIDMSPIGDYGDYYYIIFLIKGHL